jgi:hypothetical protein
VGGTGGVRRGGRRRSAREAQPTGRAATLELHCGIGRRAAAGVGARQADRLTQGRGGMGHGRVRAVVLGGGIVPTCEDCAQDGARYDDDRHQGARKHPRRRGDARAEGLRPWRRVLEPGNGRAEAERLGAADQVSATRGPREDRLCVWAAAIRAALPLRGRLLRFGTSRRCTAWRRLQGTSFPGAVTCERPRREPPRTHQVTSTRAHTPMAMPKPAARSA